MNLRKEFEKAKAWIELGSLIIGFIKSLEELFPDEGQGQLKLALLRQWIEKVFGAFTSVFGSLDNIWPEIEQFVAATVATFNKLGFFKKREAKGQ